MYVALVQAAHQREQRLEACVGGQPLQIDPQPRVRSRPHFVAYVDLGGRVVAEQDDPESRRAAHPGSKRVDVGQYRFADRGTDGIAVEPARGGNGIV